jgi:hypothetical protein
VLRPSRGAARRRWDSRAATRWTIALALGALSACTGVPGGPRAGGPDLGPAREDRVVIPSMAQVQAVAVSQRYVYVATPAALGVYDRQFDRWLPPVSRREGWPGGQPTLFVGDPNDDVLWFATTAGLFRYRALVNDLQRTTFADQPRQVFFDRGDPAAGAYIIGAQRTWRVSSLGMAQPITLRELPPPVRRVAPMTLADIVARWPALRDFAPLLTQDAELRSWPITSGAASPERSEVWLGTAGGGLLRVDPQFVRAEAKPFGLLEPGAGAIAATSEGLWVAGAGDRLTPRQGLTWTDHELRQWRWLDGGPLGPVTSGRAQAVAPWGAYVWVGGDRGLQRVEAATGRGATPLTEADGLPSALVLALAPTPSGVFVGTARGLVFVSDSGAGARPFEVGPSLLAGTPIRALARRGDTLWIGTDAGVAVLPAGESRPRRLRSVEASPRLARPVSALAIADTVLAVGTTSGELFLLHTGDGRELPPPLADVGRAGPVVAVAMDGRALWVAGPNGVTVIARPGGAARYLPAGTELPGDVTSLALQPRWAWVGTRDGIVRYRREADGSIR